MPFLIVTFVQWKFWLIVCWKVGLSAIVDWNFFISSRGRRWLFFSVLFDLLKKFELLKSLMADPFSQAEQLSLYSGKESFILVQRHLTKSLLHGLFLILVFLSRRWSLCEVIWSLRTFSGFPAPKWAFSIFLPAFSSSNSELLLLLSGNMLVRGCCV